MAKVMRVKVMFLDEVLGTNPGSKDIHEKFIASKGPNAETREDELAHLPESEVVAKEKTVFYRVDGEPAIACYHWLGFFKDTCGALRVVDGTESKKLKAYKKKIDGLIKVYPDFHDVTGRYIKIDMAGEMGDCQRPLRAQTLQGERVALANSETIPKGSTLQFDIVLLDESMESVVREWLDYGIYRGMGQWRSSGKGAFCWAEINDDGEIIGGNYSDYQ